MLYFTYWFPRHHHARIVSGFLIGLPIAVAAGAPISTGILWLDGMFGLHGWQIMYIAEAIPTVLIGVVTLFVLTDRPEQARFLTAEEKTWLANKLLAERRAKEEVKTFGVWQSMFDPKVLLLSLNYFGIVVASLGMLIFIPQIIKSIGAGSSNMAVGWLTMVPYLCGGISLVVWGRISDRMHERRWNLLAACLVSAIGLFIAGYTMGSWWAMVGDVARSDGLLWLERAVLGDAINVPDGHRGGGLDRMDQLNRQSGRVLRPLVCRCDEGCDRELRWWALRLGTIVSGFRDHLRLIPEYSERGGCTDGATGGGSRGLS